MKFYNLDAIISIGYRINSIRATQFRQWATNILKTFTIQGHVLDKQTLLENLDKLHATEMGMARIKKNLSLEIGDVVEFCRNKVLDQNCNIYKQGKNWYCETDHIKITINAHSYTIITAHVVK